MSTNNHIRKRTSIISVRVSDDVKEELEVESELTATSLNTLIGQILKKHVEWDRFAEDIGIVVLPKSFIKEVLEHVDDKTLTTIAGSTSKCAIKDSMLFIKGKADIESFLEVLDLWLSASNISFRHIAKNQQDKYIVQHDLGPKWTIYFTTVTSTLLSELGFHMTNQVMTEQNITFEIVKA